MELYIVRHGQSLAQTGEDKGPDPHLSELGLKQAELLGISLADIPFDIIFSSHLTRAFQTAVGVAKHQNSATPITIVPELAECGTAYDWIPDKNAQSAIYPEIIRKKDCIGSEPVSEQDKSEYFFEKYIFPLAYESEFTSIHDSNEGPVASNDINVIAATHGMFNAYLIGKLVNFPFDQNMVVEQNNTCVNHFSLYTVNGVRRVKFISYNDTHHLCTK